MYCSKCGSQLLDGAAFCPSCGNNINGITRASEAKTGNLCLYWAQRQGASIRKTRIEIDDKDYGLMSAATVRRVTLSEGKHNIKFYQKKRLLLNDNVDIYPDYETTYAYKETMGFSHPWIKRVDAIPPASVGGVCPKCGGIMQAQLTSEQKRPGCLTVLLAISIIGWIVLIPGLLSKNKAATYMVCSNCGYKVKANRWGA